MKTDPIRFFDDKGHSWLSRDHLVRRIAELEEENAKLKRVVLAQHRRQNGLAPAKPAAPTIN